jgi:hypothetical protein
VVPRTLSYWALVDGLDDIGLTLQKKDKITVFEKSRSTMYPWQGSVIDARHVIHHIVCPRFSS